MYRVCSCNALEEKRHFHLEDCPLHPDYGKGAFTITSNEIKTVDHAETICLECKIFSDERMEICPHCNANKWKLLQDFYDDYSMEAEGEIMGAVADYVDWYMKLPWWKRVPYDIWRTFVKLFRPVIVALFREEKWRTR